MLREIAHRGLDNLRAALAREGHYVSPPTRRLSQPPNAPAEERSCARPPLPPSAARPDRDAENNATSSVARGATAAGSASAAPGSSFGKGDGVISAPSVPVKVVPQPRAPVRERDIFVGPKLGATIVKKRPRTRALDELENVQAQYVRASAPLARRLLASLLDPSVVAQADRNQASPEPTCEAPPPVPQDLSAPSVPAKVGGDEVETPPLAMDSSDIGAPPEAANFNKKPRVESHLSLGSSLLDARVRRQAPGIELAISSKLPREEAEAMPSASDVTALKSLLAEHGIPSHFMTGLCTGTGLSPRANVAREPVLETVAVVTAGDVKGSQCNMNGRNSAIDSADPLPKKECGPVCVDGSADENADLDRRLDQNHCVIMGMRRARAEAEYVSQARRVELRAAERGGASFLAGNIAEVAQVLAPRVLAHPLDVASVAVSLAASRGGAAKQEPRWHTGPSKRPGISTNRSVVAGSAVKAVPGVSPAVQNPTTSRETVCKSSPATATVSGRSQGVGSGPGQPALSALKKVQ